MYTENASVMNRGEVIKSVNGPDRVEWARNEGMRVHDFGDVQVITGVLHLRGRGSAGAFEERTLADNRGAGLSDSEMI